MGGITCKVLIERPMKNTKWTNYWNEINPKKENKRNLIRVGPDRLADPSSVLHWSLPPSSASQTLKVKGRSKKGGKRFRLTNLFWNLKYGQSLIFGIATILPPLPRAPLPKCWQLFQLGNKIAYKTLKNGQNTQNFDSYAYFWAGAKNLHETNMWPP